MRIPLAKSHQYPPKNYDCYNNDGTCRTDIVVDTVKVRAQFRSNIFLFDFGFKLRLLEMEFQWSAIFLCQNERRIKIGKSAMNRLIRINIDRFVKLARNDWRTSYCSKLTDRTCNL